MERQAFELMVITPEKDYPAETRWLNRLFSEGLATLHLRKPDQTGEELLEYLMRIEEQYHKRIMLHGDSAVGEKLSLKGIHYPVAALPAHKPGYRVSCSTHNWQELEEVSSKIDYAFISPFFDSISKSGYRANKGLMKIPGHGDRHKAVALGGIHDGNIQEIQALGLKGAALLGAIWQTDDPLEAYRKLRTQTGR